MTASPPTVSGDKDTWGTKLDAWLLTQHNADGTHPQLNQDSTGKSAKTDALNSASTAVAAAAAPATGQVLTATDATHATWQTPSASFTNPMTTKGDILVEDATPAAARLAGPTSATKQFLTSTGTGSAANVPSWGTIASGDVPTLNQNTTGTAANVTGTVAISNGGSGQTAQQAAIDALAGTQSSGKYLRSDGTHTTLDTLHAGDVTGTVAVANGGTGQTTAQAAINALAGTQSSGKYLRSDGTNTTLDTIHSGDVPTLNQNTSGTAANITGTLDGVPAPTGNVSLNSHKIASLSAGSAAADAVNFGQVNSLLATTGITGYAKVNSAGTVLSWTAPSDSAMHRVAMYAVERITSTETGGAIQVTVVFPDGSTATSKTLFTASQTAGYKYSADASCPSSFLVGPGGTLTVSQTSALSAGASTAWIEFWGS